MSSPKKSSGRFLVSPSLQVVLTLMLKRTAVCTTLITLLLLTFSAIAAAKDVACDNQTLQQNSPTDYMDNLKVVGVCNVTGTGPGPLKFYFHNVNIINGGELKFHDDNDIDFYAESILVEFAGKLTAVTTQSGYLPQTSQLAGVLPYRKRLTIHLWGAPSDPGIECASPSGQMGAPCGIPDQLWSANPEMADALMMEMPPPPKQPKNQPCKSITGYSQYLPGDDCFYQYEVQDSADRQGNRKAYFGHKVLAVSFGGSLQLFGSKGVSYLMQGQQCMPSMPGNECNPAFTGKSWVRLTGVTDPTHITVSSAVDWQQNDVLAVTPTDYLPSHTEEVIVDSVSTDGKSITLKSPGLKWGHNGNTFSFAAAPVGVGPNNDPNLPELNRAIDTRAAVALLTRNIQIVSAGNTPADSFEEKPGNYFGGHTIVRQGFASYQVQGVEFYQLGQGGDKGRYSVHFHMLRKTPQPSDPAGEPLNYLKDCSIHDSMTRWVTVHATEGMYLARNVGEKSIGHGYYLEDATETNNRIYSNIGILARAAIQDAVHNPRQVPGILADNTPHNGLDYMPYRSDYNHPSIFWITNGWNDFQYNFAAGAATCGACYWWLPAAVSGPSQYQTFGGYASQQIVTNADTNYNRAGLVPLENFVGNSCVAAMTSFQMNGQTGECLGVMPNGSSKLSAVQSTAPPGPDGALPNQPFQLYYPVVGELHNPSICTASDCSANSANQSNPPCDSTDSHMNCAVTKLDHYTTSFNFAQTNFAAVWLRKGWDLFSNGAVTDVLQGGLNFVTGGGYTRSDVSLGEWLVARNTVFVGHTQSPAGNPFALDVGPFNSKSGLVCQNPDPSHCEYSDGGVSFNLPPFPAQKLLNIYDGPSQQDSNAYMDITKATVNCTTTGDGNCPSDVPLTRNFGVLQDKTETQPSCYLPNAAIGWKQPNGFYYPPAFHSRKLWFENVDIRHFVIEPLFKPITPEEDDPFQQDQNGPRGVTWRYCTYSSDMFSASFNHIDRQTVLNDDDGTLTGLLGAQIGSTHTIRPTISINEDSYFNTPLGTPECLSDLDIKPPLPINPNLPYSATTSPYEWLSTAIIAECYMSQCSDQGLVHWARNCQTRSCRGVPLYREYLTKEEKDAGVFPQIRMMGQGTGQRSTLSLNHGAYYLDTQQTCDSQGGCTPDPQRNPTVFQGGHTYYVYFIYATEKTQQHYDLFVGKGTTLDNLKVTPWWIDPNNYDVRYTPNPSNFVTPTYDSTTGILGIDIDLTGQKAIFDASRPLFCTPASYCSYNKATGSCGCKDPNNCNNADCGWAINDIDCPVDTSSRADHPMHCFGFGFTLPANFSPTHMPPPDNLFAQFPDMGYFNDTRYTNPTQQYPGDVCKYTTLPAQPAQE
jgi:hypothetical protein